LPYWQKPKSSTLAVIPLQNEIQRRQPHATPKTMDSLSEQGMTGKRHHIPHQVWNDGRARQRIDTYRGTVQVRVRNDNQEKH